MIIKQVDQSTMESEFGVLSQRLDIDEAPVSAPFGSMWVVTEPGGSSVPEDHPDTEMVVAVQGRGKIAIGSDEQEISPGTLICVPPHEPHVLHNGSEEHPLTTLHMFWELDEEQSSDSEVSESS